MPIISRLSARLQNHPKRIVLPEGNDVRILQASRQFATRKLGVPILLGNKAEIEDTAKKNDIRLDGIRIIEPNASDDIDELIKILKVTSKFKKLSQEELMQFVLNPNYFATLMLVSGRADALVAGATTTSSSALRPLFQIVPLQKTFKTASSMAILQTQDMNVGVKGNLFLADCGVIPEPTEEQLADIAINTAILAHHLTNERAKVAMLSYSSKSSNAKLSSVLKMKSATALAHEFAKRNYLEIDIDGELQVDSALIPEVANFKGIASSVAGKANVLVFPDLNCGNITLKMVQTLSKGTNSYGQIITGLVRPAAEISRGSTAADIFGTMVIVSAQAVDRRFLFPEMGQ